MTSAAQQNDTTDFGIDLEPARQVAAAYVAEGTLPCVAFGVVDAAGRSASAIIEGPERDVDRESIFFLGSITKGIVAVALLQYADEGRLDIHAPLARYIPELKGTSSDGISAWHVLTHTSGLPDMTVEELRRERPTYERSLRFVLESTPRTEPGAEYDYNSAAWLLLSETMARLSNMAFGEALATRLSGPLGMVDTGFDPRPQRERVVPVHGFRADNRLVQGILLRFLAKAQLPGGGMFGTLPDLLRLGRVLLPADEVDPAPRVLTQATIDEMTRNHTEGMTHVSEDGVEREVRQGLGWRKPLPEWPGSDRVFTHGGISGGRLWVDPDASLAYVFLTNLWQAPLEAPIAVLDAVYRARS